jgi:anti-sigma factor RsiW
MLMPKTIHPTSRTLIAYMDGELPVEERHGIQSHLRSCASCREEVDTMETDLDWFLVLEAASRDVKPAPPPIAGLNKLLAATRQWTVANLGADPGRIGGGLEQRVNQALELFFGSPLAGGSNGKEAVPAEKAESLLSTFLGRRAAATLMTDIRRGNPERLAAPDAF